MVQKKISPAMVSRNRRSARIEARAALTVAATPPSERADDTGEI